jgi:hypothetical protein
VNECRLLQTNRLVLRPFTLADAPDVHRLAGYGFGVLGLNRIFASHFRRNPASGCVTQKIGMAYEGCSRQHVQKWGVFEDLECYGILKGEYDLKQDNRSIPQPGRP